MYQSQDITPKSFWTVLAGFLASVAVMVVHYLAPSVISQGLSDLIVGILMFAGITFHFNVVSGLNTQVTSLRSAIASLDAPKE